MASIRDRKIVTMSTEVDIRGASAPLTLEITAAQAVEIHQTSQATLSKILADIDRQIRVAAETGRMVVIRGTHNHVSYHVRQHGKLELSSASKAIVDVLQRNGFSARFEQGETYKARGSDEMLTPYELTIRW